MNNQFFDPSSKFVDPEKVLFAAGVTNGQTVADFGAGSGFYTFAAAKIVGEQGMVIAVDVVESTLEHIAAEGRLKGLRNIRTMRTDLEKSGSLPDVATGSVDTVVFGSVLHQLKDRKAALVEAYRILKTGGKLVMIEWNESPSPIGPSAAERLSQAEAAKQASSVTFKPAGSLPTDSYHYGLMFIK